MEILKMLIRLFLNLIFKIKKIANVNFENAYKKFFTVEILKQIRAEISQQRLMSCFSLRQ